jgi:multisubunit Na+/H+ antiporter MnhB subunit
VFLPLPREPHTTILAARQCRVKRAPLFSAILLTGAVIELRRFAARAPGLAFGQGLSTALAFVSSS